MAEERKPKSATLTIESELKNVCLVGVMAQSLCRFEGMDGSQCDRVELSVVEAVNNAIIHAYNREPNHLVEVAIRVYPDRMVFEISDRGKRLEKFAPTPPDYDPGNLDTLPEEKMGLFLIASPMDRTDYSTESGRNVLTLTKYLKKDRS